MERSHLLLAVYLKLLLKALSGDVVDWIVLLKLPELPAAAQTRASYIFDSTPPLAPETTLPTRHSAWMTGIAIAATAAGSRVVS